MEQSTVAWQIRLLYFNGVLLEKQVISPAEARQMQHLILRESYVEHPDRPD